MDVNQFKNRMGSLAYGNAMMHAAEDYKREMMKKQKEDGERPSYGQVNVEELVDDPELQKLYEERIQQMKEEQEKRQIMQRKGHGKYEEIVEKDFLEATTKTETAVCHFFHRDFERCRIMDKHLTLLAHKYFETRFFKISAPDSPFFTDKLNVRILPCVIFFVNGVAVERVVGFDDFGKKDDFSTADLEDLMMACGVVTPKQPVLPDGEEEDYLESKKRTIVRGGFNKTASDEDSDFD